MKSNSLNQDVAWLGCFVARAEQPTAGEQEDFGLTVATLAASNEHAGELGPIAYSSMHARQPIAW